MGSPTPSVDLTAVSTLSELVLRGGDFAHATSRQSIKAQYARANAHYPDVHAGLSCLFRPGASLDELAREGAYRNPKLSVAIVQRLVAELGRVGHQPRLYVTPVQGYPDHHTLAIVRNTVVQLTLADDAIDALIPAMTIVDNPYRAAP